MEARRVKDDRSVSLTLLGSLVWENTGSDHHLVLLISHITFNFRNTKHESLKALDVP